ncbi:hypothetical protein [Ochrobactrum chromiisoli]|uniref:Uncharacterized protein n=1 Tax=Ochrobactrum chromiisoli TaxID=2993941 RepID=A0ABT3QIC3_9HYPH|nr:hypothetical protein [Ochrobactrum chromiisoli]MCX2695362.1 hypothetical protein [Ochrobactrum chromiisoli]
MKKTLSYIRLTQALIKGGRLEKHFPTSHLEAGIVKLIGTAHGTLGRGFGGLLNGEKYG